MKNTIVLTSYLVSVGHGRFIYKGVSWATEDKVAYKYSGSTNGLVYNNVSEGVLFVFSSAD